MRKDKITFRVPVVEANLPSNLARSLSLLLCHFARCQIPSKATTWGRYVFSWGGGEGRGFRGGSSMKVSTKRGGLYLFVSYSRGGSHTFSRIF